MRLARVGWMRIVFVLCCRLAAGHSTPVGAEPDDPNIKQWTFDAASPGALPGTLTVGTLLDGRPAGEWKIMITDRAQSPGQVLAQVQAKGTDQAHKLLMVSGTESTNLDVSVSFLAVSGKADLGGGLAWHVADDRNYYLLRASFVEQKLRLYRVVKGVPQILKQVDRSLPAVGWHRLRVVQQGCEIRGYLDDGLMLRICDPTLTNGRIGLWTKADAVTYFDDLELRLLK